MKPYKTVDEFEFEFEFEFVGNEVYGFFSLRFFLLLGQVEVNFKDRLFRVFFGFIFNSRDRDTDKKNNILLF